MNPVAYLEFEETTKATGTITKFGGQPWGLRQADWPKSPKGGQPLEFIAQIVLEPRLFPGADNQIAYVFWDPRTLRYDDGLVLVRKPAELTDGFAEGPAVGRMVRGPRKFLFREKQRVPCEFKVRLTAGEEPPLDELKKILDEDDPESERLLKQRGITIDELVEKLETAKIGGTPLFIQSSSYLSISSHSRQDPHLRSLRLLETLRQRRPPERNADQNQIGAPRQLAHLARAGRDYLAGDLPNPGPLSFRTYLHSGGLAGASAR